MNITTLDDLITDAVEQKLQDNGIWNVTTEAAEDITIKVKQNMVDVAMVGITKEYMKEVVDNYIDWDKM